MYATRRSENKLPNPFLKSNAESKIYTSTQKSLNQLGPQNKEASFLNRNHMSPPKGGI